MVTTIKQNLLENQDDSILDKLMYILFNECNNIWIGDCTTKLTKQLLSFLTNTDYIDQQASLHQNLQDLYTLKFSKGVNKVEVEKVRQKILSSSNSHEEEKKTDTQNECEKSAVMVEESWQIVSENINIVEGYVDSDHKGQFEKKVNVYFLKVLTE